MPALKNIVHERFARYVAKGMSLRNAALKADPEYKGNAPHMLANQLRKRPDVDARITELVDEDCKKLDLGKEDVLRMLAQMVQLAPSEASLDSNLCDLRYVGKEAMPVAVIPDRLRTLERLAKMQGWDKENLEISASKDVLEMLEEFRD